VIYGILPTLCTSLKLATMGYHIHRGYLESIPSLLWFGLALWVLGAFSWFLRWLVSVMRCLSHMVVCYASPIPCGGFLVSCLCLISMVIHFCSFWRVSGRFPTCKSICLCHLAHTSFLLCFVVICVFDVGLVMIRLYKHRFSPCYCTRRLNKLTLR